MAKKSELESMLKMHLLTSNFIKRSGLDWLHDKRFHDTRRWRFDFQFPGIKLAVECQGGIWMKKGGHSSGAGIQKDLEKYDEAMRMGWTVYCCSKEMIDSGRAIETIELLIGMLLVKLSV